jgi:hypothetical protein
MESFSKPAYLCLSREIDLKLVQSGSPALSRRKTSPAVKTVRETAPQFVELTSAAIGQPRCTVELHNNVGATLRIELQGGDLSGSFGYHARVHGCRMWP